jgi:hypothetical protein
MAEAYPSRVVGDLQTRILPTHPTRGRISAMTLAAAGIKRADDRPAASVRTIAAALVLAAVVLAGSSGVVRVGTSGEPPTQAVAQATR